MSLIEWGLTLWLGVLTVLVFVLFAYAQQRRARQDTRVSTVENRLAVLEAGQKQLLAGHQRIEEKLGELALAQQVDDLRRGLLADLRPVVAETLALALGSKRAGKRVGTEFGAGAQVYGPVAGGDVRQE